MQIRSSPAGPPLERDRHRRIQAVEVPDLAPPNSHGGGVAGFVMANGSLSTGSGGEGAAYLLMNSD